MCGHRTGAPNIRKMSECLNSRFGTPLLPQCDVADAAEAGDGGIRSEDGRSCLCRILSAGPPAEVGGGVRLPAWTNGVLNVSVAASITPNQTHDLRLAPRRNGFSVIGTFEGEFSNVTRSYTGKGVVRYVW